MKFHQNIRRTRAGGFSLIEVLVVAALLTLVIGSLAMIGGSSDRAYRTGATASYLEAQAVTTIERVFAELRIAGRETLTSDPLPGIGSTQIRYLQATGISNGQIEWSPLRRLALEYEVGEVDDGLDNNGNGLVDEGQLVLIEDVGGPGERRRVLTRWVRELLEGEEENGADDNGNGLIDEHGFIVERIGETLVIRLTLEKRDPEGRLIVRTASTSTRLRN